ncbi:hypothetical protein KJ841_01940 [Patescibacteria group bacterium]|nr:hypothetical protein [Patescibacteria group bacterium]
MENKKNVIIIILTIVDSLLFLLGISFWLSFSMVSRCGHSGMISALFALRRFESLVILILVVIIAFWILSFIKRDREKFKIIRIITMIYLAISLILIIIGIVFVGSYYGSTTCATKVAIKADLAGLGLRDSANRYAENNDNSYEGFCNNSEDVALVAENIEKNKSKLYCNDSLEKWAVCANHDKAEYSCVDSGGNFKVKDGVCDENWNYTSCP